MDEKDRGGRPSEVKVKLSREDAQELDAMAHPLGATSETVASMLLHVALARHRIAVVPRSLEETSDRQPA